MSQTFSQGVWTSAAKGECTLAKSLGDARHTCLGGRVYTICCAALGVARVASETAAAVSRNEVGSRVGATDDVRAAAGGPDGARELADDVGRTFRSCVAAGSTLEIAILYSRGTVGIGSGRLGADSRLDVGLKRGNQGAVLPTPAFGVGACSSGTVKHVLKPSVSCSCKMLTI